MVKTTLPSIATAAVLATTALLLSTNIPTTQAFFLPAHAPAAHRQTQTRTSTYSRSKVVAMVGPADLQASLINRFRAARNAERPNVLPKKDDVEEKKKAASAAAAAATSKSTSKNDDVDRLVDTAKEFGQKLSRFTAAVLEDEDSRLGTSSTSTSTSSITGSTSTSSSSSTPTKTLKGISDTFMKSPVVADENSIRGASATVGAVVGFALGGPLLALVGAAWTSYSCTVTNSDAGEAARGTGKWALDTYNFFTKMNRKYSFVQKVSSSVGGFWGRFKKEMDAPLLDKAESSLQTTLDFSGKVSKELNLPELVGQALIKGGELSVYAVKGLVKYNEEKKLTEKFVGWVKKEVGIKG